MRIGRIGRRAAESEGPVSSNPLRIGVVTHLEQINSNYRSLAIQQLQKRGHYVKVEHARIGVARLAEFDVVHFYRFTNRDVRFVARDLRALGIGIVWDNDDDMTAGDQRKRGALRSQSEKLGIREMLALSHVVTTPSPLLAAQYREWGAEETFVVDNFLPNWFTHVPTRHDGEIRVGWMAAKEHRDDDAALGISELLATALDRHPELRVETIGIRLKVRSDRYENSMHVTFDQLPERLSRFDIGIAPLADTAFNQSRSRVKLKEYASCGAAWLASPIGPYRGLGADEGGLLVPDDGWAEALERLISDQRERRRLAANGLKWAQSEMANRATSMLAWERPLMRASELAKQAVPA